jgi:hypothetical protein
MAEVIEAGGEGVVWTLGAGADLNANLVRFGASGCGQAGLRRQGLPAFDSRRLGRFRLPHSPQAAGTDPNRSLT